ncbi:hypothetical protein CXF83_22240 [Shewanella sp. Choline-02u-19]|uniref:DUF418 domain-containing protein n=1 Tax=Shewanella sp. Choline-02u-19 TaxID=2058309 RepID=UPI000C330A41|nr:DUF418 domain-containing protein [Shewanella sp. Choline-02u-19]PKH59347.1 hypothetical protein CXF84_03235 [Shewanella sp. Bg11-22]PKI29233.1 hypothetical protein CXF83_22240 [Shewanella sp. Choline-02u-19]
MEPLTVIINNPSQNPTDFDRNANIDVIRGLAVLGILFINIYFFGNAISGYASHESNPLHDILVELFSNFFIEGRFISLFSMLFGVGLAIQFDRLSAQNRDAYQLVKSRLKWLVIFGVIHAIFIWSGDVLFTYALSGFVALCYLKLDHNKLLKKSLLFIAAPVLLLTLMSLLSPEEKFIRGSALFEEESLIWFGSYAEQLTMQLTIFATMLFVIPLTLMWLSAGLMLLGIALYRKGIFEHGFNKNQLIQLAVATVLLSVFDSLLTLSTDPILNTLSGVAVIVSAIPMALIYIHILVKICQNRSTVLAPLQKVGQLSLSLYILQSICGVLVFRYFAPTLVNTLDRPGYMLIALGFSIFQIILASVYLKYFKQGPLEMLWRKLAKSKPTPTQDKGVVQ